MKLEKYKEDAQFFTGKLSDINRQLSFAGIAIIWIFKNETDGNINIPNELIIPIILFVISLMLDFVQYVYGATAWTIFFRYHEKQKVKHTDKKEYKNDNIKASKVLSNISYFGFFYPKIIANLVGYVFMIIYLLKLIIKFST